MVAKSDQLSTPFVSLEGGDGLLRGNPTAPLTARREPFELSSAAQARASVCALLRKGLKAFSTSGSCFTGTGPTIRKVPSVITATPRLRGTGSRPLAPPRSGRGTGPSSRACPSTHGGAGPRAQLAHPGPTCPTWALGAPRQRSDGLTGKARTWMANRWANCPCLVRCSPPYRL